MWFKLSQIILRNRVLILSVIGVVTIFFGYFAATNLKLDNKYGNMLPKKSPAQENYQKFKEMFGEDGGTLVIAIQTDNLYTESNFLKWKELGEGISAFDGVSSVISEADLYAITNNTEESKFEAVRIFQDQTFQEKSIQELRKEIRKNPLYNNLLYNDSTSVSLMMINVEESFLSNQKKSKVVLEIEEFALDYEKYFGKLHFAGLPHIRVVIGKRIIGEMYIFIGLAIAVTSLLIFIFFRSFKVVLFCNIVVFVAVIWSLGLIGLFGFKLSILMALIPPLMIVIGIPNCIFLLTKFHREVKDHGNKTKALSRVIQKVGNATFLTNLTTALGFSTFIFTNSEKLIEFGTIASINILMVFVLSITIIPIVFSISKSPKPKHLKHLEKTYTNAVIDKFVHLASNKRPLVYAVAIGVVMLSLIGLSRIEATGNLTSDLPDSDPILKDIQFIERNFGGAVPFELMIDYKVDGRKLSSYLLSKVEGVQKLLAEDTLFSKSLSVVDLMKTINMAYYGNDPERYELIGRKDMRRLGSYVNSFQDDVRRINQLHGHIDAVKQGQKEYADTILLNYPLIWNTFSNNDSIKSPDELDAIKGQANFMERLEKVVQNDFPEPTTNVSMKELVDTANTTLRVRMQILDIGSYEIAALVDSLKVEVDSILNPERPRAEVFFAQFNSGKKEYLDSLFALSNAYRINLATEIARGNDSLVYEMDMDPELIYNYLEKEDFSERLRAAIDLEYIDFLFTGTSVVAAEGTQYLVKNLLISLAIAIVIIAILMSLLFGSWRMVIISLIPNFIPLIVTAGIMGFFHIPIKPSTILVFSIAFGISVDDTIHFLAKYRQELKGARWDLRGCVINALRETGLSMFYTSIVLFFGFSMFALSQFGGTQALGLLVSLTLLVAMVTNLAVLPSLLLTLENRIANKAFEEPLIVMYDEETDIELDDLEVDITTKRDPE
jgi:predicted RND superfamily exporter protein